MTTRRNFLGLLVAAPIAAPAAARELASHGVIGAADVQRNAIVGQELLFTTGDGGVRIVRLQSGVIIVRDVDDVSAVFPPLRSQPFGFSEGRLR
jgi:hypothetical protein